jgi:hypothetical protein
VVELRKVKDLYYLVKHGYKLSDTWSIKDWFMEIMPKMIKDFKDNLHSYPSELTVEEWEQILHRMIFLLKEMNEFTCSYKNKYDEPMQLAREEFWKKYGMFGENFEKIKGLPNTTVGKRMYFPADDEDRPEWKELKEVWFEEVKKIAEYQDKCKNEFFDLFSKYFWDMWD